ncbi:MAG TPA: competence protein ComJ [Xanthobacteraceae bacterium]|jgi:hypothetical protein
MTSFPLTVSHAQLAVFGSCLKKTFNFWTEKHVHQGFAWRAGSVSFRTIEEAGRHIVEVTVSSADIPISIDAVRVIEVPFAVPANGSIEVASISDAYPLELPPGGYALRFDCFRSDGASDPRQFGFLQS